MQVALLVSEHEWHQLLADVQRLKASEALHPPVAPRPPDRLLNVREAADYLHLQPEGVRKARRAGRLSGIKLNEKEWGFRESELNCYPLIYFKTTSSPTLDHFLTTIERYDYDRQAVLYLYVLAATRSPCRASSSRAARSTPSCCATMLASRALPLPGRSC